MQQLKTIDGHLFREMIMCGAQTLEKNKENVDALNVFPVPDGDTGTNMTMTVMAAAREGRELDTDNIGIVASSIAKGALKGARGNSGVILSQILRGFSKSIGKSATIDSKAFALALKEGSDTAYKAVIKPKEGTMLTVARVIAEEALRLTQNGDVDDVYELINLLLIKGEEVLRLTPELLPVLKEAGVVDAGGKGLLLIYAGYKSAMDGEKVNTSIFDIGQDRPLNTTMVQDEEEINFAYCTEFFLKNFHKGMGLNDIDKLRERLIRIGDCVLVVGDPDLVKVHVHTNVPGQALQLALAIGELSGVKIDNMREQHRSILGEASVDPHFIHAVAKKKNGVVVVSVGEGLSTIFKDLGADEIIQGGQTMNPSTDDILQAIERVPSNTVYVFPNNSNIILAANQAKELSNKNVHIIPTKSVPAGICAMITYEPSFDSDKILSNFDEALQSVVAGQITYAIRDSHMNNNEIKEGDILGMCNGSIEIVGNNITDVMLDVLDSAVTEDSSLITIYYGNEVNENDAEALKEQVSNKFEDCDVEVHYGGQPIYYYSFSIE